MEKYRYVIIGGGIAGGRTAEGIRKVDKNGSIVLVTDEQHRPYERPPLSKKYLREEVEKEKVFLQGMNFYQENNVEILDGRAVIKIDRSHNLVILDNDTRLEYESLMLATGGRANRLPLPGNELENVFTLRTIEDANAIRSAAGNGKTALVMGGSFIGAEVAASLSQMGTEVIEIFPESRLLELIAPEEFSQHVHKLFDINNIRVLPGTVAEILEEKGQSIVAKLDNGETEEIDFVVMGVGIQLNTDLAKDAGLEIRDGDGAILVDEYLRTSDPNIYAAGDIAAWPDTTFEHRLRVEHWDVARRQGLRGGRNMAGDVEPYTALPYFFSDLFDLSFEVWGDLSKWDQTVRRGTLDSGSFAYFYFVDDKLTGVFAIDRPDDERIPMQTLIKERASFGDIAEQVADEQVHLDDLIETEVESDVAPTGEISFNQDIRPLFREKDIEEMKDIAGFDLSNYDDAREWADGIYSTLADGSMPCDGPWPDEDIAKFKKWMETDFKP